MRLAESLDDPARLYTQAEVNFLLAAAEQYGRSESGSAVTWRAGFEAGQRAAEAEASVGYPPPPYLIVAGAKVRGDQAAARAEAAADRTQRYTGGPADDWGASRPEPDHGPSAARWHRDAGVPAEFVRGEWRWA